MSNNISKRATIAALLAAAGELGLTTTPNMVNAADFKLAKSAGGNPIWAGRPKNSYMVHPAGTKLRKKMAKRTLGITTNRGF